MTRRIVLLFFLLSASWLSAHQQKINQVNTLLNKTIHSIQMEEYDQALLIIQEAKSINPDLVEIYRLEAQLQEILGNKDEAIVAWEYCLNHAESDSLKEEAEVHINHLKD